MASLFQSVKYEINTLDTQTMGYYLLKFVLEAYTLRYETTCDRQIVWPGELVVNTQYISCRYKKKTSYWDQKKQQNFIIVRTRTIVYQCIDVVSVKYVNDITRSAWYRNQSTQALERNPICMTDFNNGYIIE